MGLHLLACALCTCGVPLKSVLNLLLDTVKKVQSSPVNLQTNKCHITVLQVNVHILLR